MPTENSTNILLTGGAGYIGAHTCLSLQQAGFNVVVYDNFSKGRREALLRVNQLTGKVCRVVEGDVRDEEKLYAVLKDNHCSAVIHLAGLKVVTESIYEPLKYYNINIIGALSLLSAMRRAEVKSLIMSSSAAVYGVPQSLPISENHELNAINPYGRTKFFVEEILRDLFCAEGDWRITILRYFNAVGAHASGIIGEHLQAMPNNLIPLVSLVALGKKEKLEILGNDYDTQDGTCVRDYIHVSDLADGHVKALESLNAPQCTSINLGTGRGHSVLDVVKAFEKVSGKKIPLKFSGRRQGDVGSSFADIKLARSHIKWRPNFDLETICEDTWRWCLMNPNGYE